MDPVTTFAVRALLGLASRPVEKAHVKGHVRTLEDGKTTWVPDHDRKAPQGRAANLQERTGIGKHRNAGNYLRAFDAEDAVDIRKAAQHLGLDVRERKARANHLGKTGTFIHFHGKAKDLKAIHEHLAKVKDLAEEYHPGLFEDESQRRVEVFAAGGDSSLPRLSPSYSPDPPTENVVAIPDRVNEGDRNEDGLVLHNSRWHREGSIAPPAPEPENAPMPTPTWTRAEGGPDLASPEFYEDPEMATLAKRVAEMTHKDHGEGFTQSQWRKHLKAGGRPDLIQAELDRRAAEASAQAEEKARKTARTKAKNEKDEAKDGPLVLPEGYKLTKATGGETFVIGPFNDSLHGRVKRLGGQWVRNGWTLDPAQDEKTKAMLRRWAKDEGEAVAIENTRKRLAEMNRWLGYLEEKVSTGYVYQRSLDELRALGAENDPEAKARMDAALQTAREARAEEEKRKEAEKQAKAEAAAERDRQYSESLQQAKKTGFPLSGNTFPHKDAIKRMGGKWDGMARQWVMPDEDSFRKAHTLVHGREPDAALTAKPGEGAMTFVQGSGDGGREHKPGTVIPTPPRMKAKDPSLPDYMMVLATRARYFREDGLSFGVGDDSGYLYTYTLRPATDDESALPRQIAAHEARKRQAQSDLRALARDVVQEGERPATVTHEDVAGEVLFDTHNIYGGGDRWVIGKDFVWHVQNNGGDGDTWGANNISTGGAGAIATRVPRTDELVAKLRAIQEALT